MSVDFSDWSAAQTPVVTILVLAVIGVMAGVVCRLVLRRLYPFGYGQIGEPVASVLVGMLAFLVAFAVCMSLGMTPGGRPSDFDGALAESYGFESVDCGNGSRRIAVPDGTEYCVAYRKGGGTRPSASMATRRPSGSRSTAWMASQSDPSAQRLRRDDGLTASGTHGLLVRKKEATMLFRITLGDWLGKGHDIKEDFLYDCNRPAAEIAAAYGMSREKYGVRFDGFRKDDPFAVWTRYGESGMSPEARGALERAGLLDGTGEPWRMRDRADLVMRFIALSMPAGFTYEPVVVPSLNGLLRANIGYGLFEGASC